MHSPSFRNFILLLIVLMLVIPLAIISILVNGQKEEALHLAKDLANELVTEISYDQQALLNNTEQMLGSFALIPEVRQRDALKVSRISAALITKTPDIANIAVTDNTGHIWASAQPLHGPINISDRRAYRNALVTGRFSSGEYVNDRILNRPAITFGYPLKDPYGRITDIVIVSFTLEHFREKLQSGLPADTSLVLDDHQGTILYSRPVSGMTGKADKADIFERMVNGPQGGSFEAIGLSKVRRIIAYRKLQLPGEDSPFMYIRVGVPLKKFVQRARDELLFNIGLLVAGTIMTAGLAIFILKRGYLDKLASLQKAASRVAGGDFSVQTSGEIIGGELGNLAGSFDNMVRQLAEDQGRRLAVEMALQDSYQNIERAKRDWELTFDAVPDLIAILDTRYRIVRCNRALASRLDTTPVQLINRPCHEVLHGSDSAVQLCPHAQLMADGIEHRGEICIPRLGGWFEVTATPLHDENGTLAGCVHIAHDITEKELLRQKNEEYNHQLQGLTRAQNFTQERERRRLATQLHDQVSQNLALSRIKLGMLHAELAGQPLASRTRELQELLEEIIDTTRSLTIEISPPALYQIGLGAALETLADTLRKRHGFELAICGDGDANILDEETKIIVYQAVRELVVNIIKHTKVHKGEIHFEQRDNTLDITVSDRGCGISTEPQTGGNCFGLFNIREQLTTIGGKLNIDSTPGSGTSVIIKVPLPGKPVDESF